MINKINKLKQYLKSNNSQNVCEIILLTHVDSPRGHDNNLQIHCAINEYLRIDEFNEIYMGIVNAGFFIKNVYFNELDFIQSYFSNSTTFDKNTIVFNLARNGVGTSKKTLIPAFCDLVRLKYTSSNSFGCSLARNKSVFSPLLREKGIQVPSCFYYKGNGEWTDDNIPNQQQVLLVKPASESASQGINEKSIITLAEFSNCQLDGLVNQFSNGVIFQEYISGYECEVPVFKIQDEIIVCEPVQIVFKNKETSILTADDSDNNDYGFKNLSESVSKSTIDNIKNIAKSAFEILQLDNYGRIDFRLNDNETPYIIDVSSTPYITIHSSFNHAFANLGLNYSDIFIAIIAPKL